MVFPTQNINLLHLLHLLIQGRVAVENINQCGLVLWFCGLVFNNKVDLLVVPEKYMRQIRHQGALLILDYYVLL